MPSQSNWILAKLFPCCYDVGDDEDGEQQQQQPGGASDGRTMMGAGPGPKRRPTARHMAETYIPSWQRLEEQEQQQGEKEKDQQQQQQQEMAAPQTGPRRTGLRRKPVAPSSSQTPPERGSSSDERQKRRQQDEPSTNEMLYFGDGVSLHQAMRTYTAGPTKPANGGPGSGSAGGGGGRTTSNSNSGRDVSGYLRTGVNDNSAMAGTYSALTYGGSTQYNFAGTQTYGAGV